MVAKAQGSSLSRLWHVAWCLGFLLARSIADERKLNFGACDKERLKKNLCHKLPTSTSALFGGVKIDIDPRLKSIGERKAVRAVWKTGDLTHIYALVVTEEGAKKHKIENGKELRHAVRTWAGTSVTPEIVAAVEGGAQDEQRARKCNDVENKHLDSAMLPPPCIVWSQTLQILLPGLQVGKKYVGYFAGRTLPELLCLSGKQKDASDDFASGMEICLGELRNGTFLNAPNYVEKILHQEVFEVPFNVTADDGVAWITTWTPPPGYGESTPRKKDQGPGAGTVVLLVIGIFIICVPLCCYVKKGMNRGGFTRFSDEQSGPVPPSAVGAGRSGGLE